MVLTSSLGGLMEEQMLLYCLIVLNINDIYIYIYIYINGMSVTLGFVQSFDNF